MHSHQHDRIIVKTLIKLTDNITFSMAKQENNVRLKRIPACYIHVRGEECVFLLQITLLTPVVVLVDGKVCVHLYF